MLNGLGRLGTLSRSILVHILDSEPIRICGYRGLEDRSTGGTYEAMSSRREATVVSLDSRCSSVR